MRYIIMSVDFMNNTQRLAHHIPLHNRSIFRY